MTILLPFYISENQKNIDIEKTYRKKYPSGPNIVKWLVNKKTINNKKIKLTSELEIQEANYVFLNEIWGVVKNE